MLWSKLSASNKPVVLTPSYKGAIGSSTSVSSLTQTNADIGTASSKRVVVVVTIGRANATTGVTIGGNAATKISTTEAVGTNRKCSIWYLNVTSGTTATIVATFAASSSCAFFWYVIYPTTATPLASDVAEGNANTLTISNLAKTEGGYVIAGLTENQSTGTISLTGTGVETIVSNFNANSLMGVMTATYSFAVTQTTTTDDYTATFNTSANVALCMASWI